MSHPRSRFRNRRPSTQYSKAVLRPTSFSSPTAEAAAEVAYYKARTLTLLPTSGRYPPWGEGESHSHTATPSVHVRTRARARIRCVRRRSRRVLVQADARSRPPARPRLIYDPRVCFQGSANKDDLHQRNSRPAGWLAGRRRPDYWECARPPTEGHLKTWK